LIALTGVRPERIDVIGEGVDLKVFNPAVDGRALREELGLPAGVPLVGMVAMLRPEKRAVDFVEAAFEVLRVVPQARFLLVGEGPQRGVVEQKIQEYLRHHVPPDGTTRLAPPVLLTGYRDDTNRILAALDIVVIPSFREARCRVLAEALASGKAVVATRVGGIPEVVQDEVNGLLVPPRETPSLVKAICRLLTNPALRSRLAMAAWMTAQDTLSLDTVMQSTLEIYSKLM